MTDRTPLGGPHPAAGHVVKLYKALRHQEWMVLGQAGDHNLMGFVFSAAAAMISSRPAE